MYSACCISLARSTEPQTESMKASPPTGAANGAIVVPPFPTHCGSEHSTEAADGPLKLSPANDPSPPICCRQTQPGEHNRHDRAFQCKQCHVTLKNPSAPSGHSCRKPSATRRMFACARCARCSALLSSKDGLLRHLQTIHPANASVACPHCGKNFPTTAYLAFHLRRLHSDVRAASGALRALRCAHCLAKFETRHGFMSHLAYRLKLIPRNIKCRYCNASFLFPDDAKRHFKQTHSNQASHKCNACTQSFKSQHGLQYHLAKVHPHRRTARAGELAFVCALCSRTFRNRSQLLIHLLKLCSVQVRRFTCASCPKAFKTRTGLDYHVSTHHGNASAKQHRCTHCSAAFLSAAAVRSHQSVHSTAKPFACCDCSATFGLAVYLKAHLRRRHPIKSEIPAHFVCRKCSKAFRSSDSLKVHVTVAHSDVRPFRCAVCLAAFKLRSPIWEHLKRCHVSVERPKAPIKRRRQSKPPKSRPVAAAKTRVNQAFKCPLCDATFKRRAALQAHATVHSDTRPFLCDQCPATYKSSVSLARHSLSHAAERPSFFCDLCPTAYAEPEGVKRHRLVHFGSYQFTCGMCTASYKRRNALTRHERIHEVGCHDDDEHKATFILACKKKCSACGLTFANQASLAAHALSKHSAAKTLFRCAVCAAALQSKYGLSCHIGTMHSKVERSPLKAPFKQALGGFVLDAENERERL